MACVTLDIEPDLMGYAVDLTAPRYYGLFDEAGQFERFTELVARHGIKLTCFVVGTVLRDRPDHIRALAGLGAEFGSHSLTHDLEAQGTEREVQGGIDSFAEFFGQAPLGYRSPFFKVTREMLEVLERNGVAYDSSYMPSLSPIGQRVYRNLDGPLGPFRWQGLSLVELPLAVIPRVRLPLALSYVKVLGKGAYTVAGRLLGYPEPLVTFLHPMNLVYSPEAFARLPIRWKVANSRHRRTGMEMLGWLLGRIRRAGFRFAALSELHEQAAKQALPKIAAP
jgi:peptidoglycan/xylan/chitin deacetylase (PgdA/CDA1 family)